MCLFVCLFVCVYCVWMSEEPALIQSDLYLNVLNCFSSLPKLKTSTKRNSVHCLLVQSRSYRNYRKWNYLNIFEAYYSHYSWWIIKSGVEWLDATGRMSSERKSFPSSVKFREINQFSRFSLPSFLHAARHHYSLALSLSIELIKPSRFPLRVCFWCEKQEGEKIEKKSEEIIGLQLVLHDTTTAWNRKQMSSLYDVIYRCGKFRLEKWRWKLRGIFTAHLEFICISRKEEKVFACLFALTAYYVCMILEKITSESKCERL